MATRRAVVHWQTRSAALLLGALLLACPARDDAFDLASVPDDAVLAKIAHVVGAVQIRHGNGLSEAAAVDTALVKLDTLITPADGYALLVLFNGRVAKVDADLAMRIADLAGLRLGPPQRSREEQLAQLLGAETLSERDQLLNSVARIAGWQVRRNAAQTVAPVQQAAPAAAEEAPMVAMPEAEPASAEPVMAAAKKQAKEESLDGEVQRQVPDPRSLAKPKLKAAPARTERTIVGDLAVAKDDSAPIGRLAPSDKSSGPGATTAKNEELADTRVAPAPSEAAPAPPAPTGRAAAKLGWTVVTPKLSKKTQQLLDALRDDAAVQACLMAAWPDKLRRAGKPSKALLSIVLRDGKIAAFKLARGAALDGCAALQPWLGRELVGSGTLTQIQVRLILP